LDILIIGDTHFGARNDSELFLEYFFDYYEQEVFPIIEQRKIKHVIQTGDLMDKRKGVNFKTLSTVTNRFMLKLKELGCELHIIPGNHDIYYRNSNQINSMTELFSWLPSIHIYNEPTTVDFSGTKIDFIPWLNKYNSEQSIGFMKKSSSEICLGHFEIVGFEMFAGNHSQSGLKQDIFGSYISVISGHYHHRSKNGNITYVGTPYEITWTDYDDPKGVHILDTKTLELEFIKNNRTMFKKLFYSSNFDYSKYDFSQIKDSIIKVVVKDKEDTKKYEWFLNKISDCAPADYVVVESDVVVVHGVDEGELENLDTFNVLLGTVEATSKHEGLDTTKMTELVTNLYQEAVTLGRDNT